jgi:hypothetical protein
MESLHASLEDEMAEMPPEMAIGPAGIPALSLWPRPSD